MFTRITLILALLAGPAIADTPHVVTDIAPVHSLVAQVMQGVGEPALLLENGGDPHDFQLRPSQARALAQADLVIWVGPDLTPWLARAVDSLTQGASLPLLDIAGTHVREAGHADHSHGHDPHAWLDPENARVWLAAIGEALAGQDPDNAHLYRANTAAAVQRMTVLSQKITDFLAPASQQSFLADHDAYGYFADRFGLTIAGTIRDSDATPPSAAHLAEMRALLAQGDVSCVLAEDGAGKGLVLTVTEGTNVPDVIVDLLGRRRPPGVDLYADTLSNLAGDIAACTADK